MKYTISQNSRGVALLAALFVLMMLSILGIGLLLNVDNELKMSKSMENSEKALKIAETGVQIARSTLFDPAQKQVVETEELRSIDGFYRGGYFLAQLKSGFQGNEKWIQWRYDHEVSGNNDLSEVTAPVFRVWATGALGVNGTWTSSTGGSYYVRNVFGLVARGTYFSIQDTGGNTEVRAHDEYTGAQRVDKDDPAFPVPWYWNYDKKLTGTSLPDVGTTNYAVDMSPMASFSDYTLKTGQAEPVLAQQTLYLVYSGNSSDPGSTDRSSTVRLRASNALCNYKSGLTQTSPPETVKSIWEFDTGLHGIGSAPAFFDPDPDVPGDEIIYFSVISRGRTGQTSALNLAANANTIRSYPYQATHDSEQVYLFAVIDTSGRLANCTATGSYKLKWARPFPDPDIIDWTDYPTEHITGTDGLDPPYAMRPADMTPLLPEEDLLVDYRDGPEDDSQWNQVRGNVRREIPVSPVVVKVLYRDSSGNLTELREDAADPYDPIIDLYMMFAAMSRVTYLRGSSRSHYFGNEVEGPWGDGWGPPSYRKPNTSQVRVIALRDRLSRSGSTWNWNAAKSRFPTFKWSYPVPPWDPDQTHDNPDDRPGHGYGPFNWDSMFQQQVAPMLHSVPWDQDGTTLWADVGGTGNAEGGQENLYTVVYPYYKCSGWTHEGANYNNTSNVGRRGPTLGEGSPVNFSSVTWADNRVMTIGMRDTWDDYMRGDRTNILATNLDKLGLSLSNPMEFYWTHTDAKGVGGVGANDMSAEDKVLITYNDSDSVSSVGNVNAPYRTNPDKIGFPRPYAWWEALWTANVRNASTTSEHGLYGQGWKGVIGSTSSSSRDSSQDLDTEGETAAMCPDCLFGQGLLVLSMNHDLSTPSATDREDLRIHAINATTGRHVWSYHLPASLSGDNANTTPSIANNLVFVAYEKFGAESNAADREARLLILDADSGAFQQDTLVDDDSDALILPPIIANGAVYIGTYTFSGSRGSSSSRLSDDYIRLFAMSPVLRLVSTGIYPFDPDQYTLNNFQNITMLNHDDIFINVSGMKPFWRRKLQVWVTGQNSKWEEVREVLRKD